MNQPAGNFKSPSSPAGEAGALIEKLELIRHPEGGWYRETWRSTVGIGDRSAGTAIYFLLETGERSQWHRVDADEIWLWHAGSALEIGIADAEGAEARRVLLGPDVLRGGEPQVLIPSGHWQTTSASRGWGLVSCFVIPGFEFRGFTLASPEFGARLDRLVPTHDSVE